MSFLRRLAPFSYLAVAAGVFVFALHVHIKRAEHVEHVTSVGQQVFSADASSPTGYAEGVRMLIVPGRDEESYQWIVQTQEMISDGQWRLREADYDNAPVGRPVQSPSPYRWWLAAVAWLNHLLTGNPIGLAIERAALWSQPALHLAIIAGVAVFVGRRIGVLSAALVSVALAIGFPFAGMFVAGAPEDAGLTQAAILASLLLLLEGTVHRDMASRLRRRWFAASGILGGLALWLNPSAAVPVISGVTLSAVVMGYCGRKRRGAETAAGPLLPWRTWGLAGAGMTLAAYLAEFAPGHLSWSDPGLVEVHPLYAAAWIGAAELVHRLAARLAGEPFVARARSWWLVGGAGVLLVALPAVMVFSGARGFLTPEAHAMRATALLHGIQAESTGAWLHRDGLTLAAFATLLPAVLLVFPLGKAVEAALGRGPAPGSVLLLGPGLVALAFAWHWLSWWSSFDTVALVLVAALAVRKPDEPMVALRSAGWIVVAVPVFLPGLWLDGELHPKGPDDALSAGELQSLVERDFAQWLARRGGPGEAIVLAPPTMTASMIYFGGMRGLGTGYRENKAGFGAAVRIAAATTTDEAEALARQRNLTHIVIPSWDPFMDTYARLGTTQVQSSLISLLHAWLPPRWLVPVPYRLPPIPGYERERVNVFEVSDVQEQELALSRLAEYFLDMGDLELATRLCGVLSEKFPEDLSCQIALARRQLRAERHRFNASLDTIVARVAEGEAENLPWDRRVSLVFVLAAGNRQAEAQEQVAACADLATEQDIRRLSTSALFHFKKLCDQFAVTLPDPSLERLVAERLPAPSTQAP